MPLSPPATAFGAAPAWTPFPLRQPCRNPYRGRSRSDKHAAVLRPQNTRPKDRRVYTPLTGNPAWLAQREENPNRGAAPKAGAGGDRALCEI